MINEARYPMETEEQMRHSLKRATFDFMHDRITEEEWRELRMKLHERLDELRQDKLDIGYKA